MKHLILYYVVLLVPSLNPVLFDISWLLYLPSLCDFMFAYNTSVICDNNNYILTVNTNPSNMHDSVAFYPSFENLVNHFKYR